MDPSIELSVLLVRTSCLYNKLQVHGCFEAEASVMPLSCTTDRGFFEAPVTAELNFKERGRRGKRRGKRRGRGEEGGRGGRGGSAGTLTTAESLWSAKYDVSCCCWRAFLYSMREVVYFLIEDDLTEIRETSKIRGSLVFVDQLSSNFAVLVPVAARAARRPILARG